MTKKLDGKLPYLIQYFGNAESVVFGPHGNAKDKEKGRFEPTKKSTINSIKESLKTMNPGQAYRTSDFNNKPRNKKQVRNFNYAIKSKNTCLYQQKN